MSFILTIITSIAAVHAYEMVFDSRSFQGATVNNTPYGLTPLLNSGLLNTHHHHWE